MSRGLSLLPVGLLLLAVTEIAVFVAVAHAIGGLWAILLLAATSLAGLALLRREGAHGWRAFRAAVASGRPPGGEVSNSLIGLFGAFLLAVPGYVSSVAGLVLVLSPGRSFARRGVERFTERRVGAAVAGDLFGPRRVKVRRGEPVVVVPTQPTPRTPAAAIDGEVVEGDIIR